MQMNVASVIENIRNSLLKEKNFYQYKNLLIVGENSSGKSKIVKEVVKNLKDDFNLYFIDSPNRNITSIRSGFETLENLATTDIVQRRVEDKYFNKEDVFTDSLGSEIILNELIGNVKKYGELFEEILKIDIQVSKEENIYQTDMSKQGENIEIIDAENTETVYINNEELDIISDAQQAMIRILVEVNFAYEKGCRTILIDEFDMNLDYINASDFIESLKKKYYDLRFIITGHSPYTVLGVNNFDIVKIIKRYEKIDENPVVIYDSNDLDNIEVIDKKIFRGKCLANDIDIKLANALKSVIRGESVNLDEFESKNELSLRQRVIFDYILERVEK